MRTCTGRFFRGDSVWKAGHRNGDKARDRILQTTTPRTGGISRGAGFPKARSQSGRSEQEPGRRRRRVQLGPSRDGRGSRSWTRDRPVTTRSATKVEREGKTPEVSLPRAPLTGRCLPPVEATQTPLVQEDRGLSLAGIRFLLNRAEQSKGVTGT